MVELLNLQQQCLNLIQNHTECGQNCTLNHYCTSVGCTTGDCSKCLHQIQYGQPNFTYSCTKITYQYHFQQDKEQQGILIHLHLLLKLLHYWSFSNNKNRIQIHACPSIPTLSSRICLEYRSFQSESGTERFSDKRGLSLSIKEKCIKNNEES